MACVCIGIISYSSLISSKLPLLRCFVPFLFLLLFRKIDYASRDESSCVRD